MLSWRLFKVFALLIGIGFTIPISLYSYDLGSAKQAPSRPSGDPEVVAEEVEVVDTCEADKICVEGQLYNAGQLTAKQVKIRVEIGGTKHSKPRYSYIEPVETSTMNPGDRQDFAIAINRKITYKKNGEDKELEVGKFNFKIVPIWSKNLDMKSKWTPKKKK